MGLRRTLYLALVREDAPQRTHDLREVFDALRWIVRAGVPWRMMPNDFPPREAVYQQTQRWLQAGVFEAMVHDLRELLRLAQERAPEPTAAVLDSRTLRSTPESGHRAGYDGAKRKKGSKVHLAVDTLGPGAVQEATSESVEFAYVDRGYTGEEPAGEARPGAPGWRWSSTPGRRRASSCCRAVGLWSVPSRGLRASGAWLGTTSGCRRRWRASTSSRFACLMLNRAVLALGPGP